MTTTTYYVLVAKKFFSLPQGASAYCAHIKREILYSFHPIDIFNIFFSCIVLFFYFLFPLFVPTREVVDSGYDVWMT